MSTERARNAGGRFFSFFPFPRSRCSVVVVVATSHFATNLHPVSALLVGFFKALVRPQCHEFIARYDPRERKSQKRARSGRPPHARSRSLARR